MQKAALEGFSLSPQQKHLWLLQQNSEAYRSQCAISLEGNLNPNALRQSLERLVSRHEILRTSFLRRPGMKIPFQVITNDTTLPWRTLDLRNRSCQEQETEIERLFQAEGRRAFDFERAPLLRCLLVT